MGCHRGVSGALASKARILNKFLRDALCHCKGTDPPFKGMTPAKGPGPFYL